MQKAEVSCSLAACVAIAAGASLSLADVQPVRKPPSDTASGLVAGPDAVARPTTIPIWSHEDRRMSLISRPRDKSGAQMSGYVKVFDRTTGDLQASFTSPEIADLFGFSVAAIGDADGDGRSEIAVGAPLSDAGGRHSGAICVFSSETGEELTKFVGEPGELLGRALGAVGDFDGDGVPDLAAGYVDRGPEPADALRRLRQRIREIDERSIGSDRDILLRRSEARVDRGSLEGSVELGRRGHDDRGSAESVPNTPAGAVRVFSVARGETIGEFEAPHEQPRFGATIAPAGDTNGDGLDDLAVSALATRSGAGVVQPAIVYVFAGRAQGGGDRGGLPLSTIVSGSAGEERDADGPNVRRIDGDRQITVTGDAIDEPQPTDGTTGETNEFGDPDCPPTLNSVVNEDGMTFLATSTEFADPTQSTSSLDDPCCDEGGDFLLSTEPGIEPGLTAISSGPLVGDVDRDGIVTNDDAIALVRFRELRGRVDIARFSRTVQMVTLQLGQQSEWMPASPEIRIFPGEPLPLEDGDAGSDMPFLTNSIEEPCCGGDGDIIDPFPCDDGGGGGGDCDPSIDADCDGIPDDQDPSPNGCQELIDPPESIEGSFSLSPFESGLNAAVEASPFIQSLSIGVDGTITIIKEETCCPSADNPPQTPVEKLRYDTNLDATLDISAGVPGWTFVKNVGTSVPNVTNPLTGNRIGALSVMGEISVGPILSIPPATQEHSGPLSITVGLQGSSVPYFDCPDEECLEVSGSAEFCAGISITAGGMFNVTAMLNAWEDCPINFEIMANLTATVASGASISGLYVECFNNDPLPGEEGFQEGMVSFPGFTFELHG